MDVFHGKLKKEHAGRILDVASGIGNFMGFLIEGFRDFDELVCMDSNIKAVQTGNKHAEEYENIIFVQGEAADMDFRDETFDTVSIANSLHHMGHLDKVLDEMKRVLKPGGFFLVMEMRCDKLDSAQMSHKKFHHLAAEIDRINGKFHENTFTKDEIVDIITDIGLEDLDIFECIPKMEKSMNNTIIEGRINALERALDKMKNSEHYPHLINLATEVKNHMRKFGYASATEIVAIGKKGQ